MKAIKLYLRLDVHKDSITIAIAQPCPQGMISLFGSITNEVHRLEKVPARIHPHQPGGLADGSRGSRPRDPRYAAARAPHPGGVPE